VALQTIIRECELRPASAEPEQPIRRNVTMSPARGTPAILERRVGTPAVAFDSVVQSSATV
jgi:hypothetical protein